jgi:hypothetical protein
MSELVGGRTNEHEDWVQIPERPFARVGNVALSCNSVFGENKLQLGLDLKNQLLQLNILGIVVVN